MLNKRGVFFTNRLKIQPIESDHAEIMFEPLKDELIYRFIPDKRYATIDELRKRYERLIVGPLDTEEEEWLNWILFLRSDLRPIGYLQASLVKDRNVAILGYVLFSTFWKQGYATEALAWVLKYLVNIAGIDVVEVYIDTRNTDSVNLVRRLGFMLLNTVQSDTGHEYVFVMKLVRDLSSNT